MKTILGRAAIALGVLVVVVSVYGVLVEPRLIMDERRYEVALPHLEPSQDGAVVAVISDLQVGMWMANVGMVERIVDRIVAVRPDVVLLGGDYVYSNAPDVEVQVDTVMGLLSPLLDSGIPTFAVLGNHDYSTGAAQELRTAFRARDVTVLQNEAAAVEVGTGRELFVVGLGPSRPGLVDVEEALDGIPESAPRVVLMHNPEAFPSLPPHTAPLGVAGHTHCGQIAVPGTPQWSYLAFMTDDPPMTDGFAPAQYGAPGNQLFVTCGIGFSLVPARIGAPPQLVLFELTAPD